MIKLLMILGLTGVIHGQLEGFHDLNHHAPPKNIKELETVSVFTREFGNAMFNCYNNADDIKNCRIYNNNNKLITESCSHDVYRITKEDFGRWQCEFMIKDKIETYVKYFNLLEIEDEVKKSETNLNNDTQLSCQYRWLADNKPVINKEWPEDKVWCKVISPDKSWYVSSVYKSFYGADKLEHKTSTEKYEVNLQTPTVEDGFKCNFYNKGPIEDNEKGTWKIEIGISDLDFIGCFFNQKQKNEVPSMTNINYEKPIFTYPSNSWTLRYSVPWPVKYCSAELFNPQLNARFYYDNSKPEAQRMAHGGICQITINNNEKAMGGTWMMTIESYSMAKLTVSVPVFVESDILTTRDKFIQAKLGEPLRIVFRVPGGIYIDKCDYVKYSKTKYTDYVVTDKSSYSTYIDIEKVTASHKGFWINKCTVVDKGVKSYETSYVYVDVV